MQKEDLKIKICESSMSEESKDKLLKTVDSYYETAKVKKADNKMWQQALKDSGNTFKQQVATINQLKTGTNKKALQTKIRACRKSLAAMEAAINGASGQQVWQITKQIVCQSKIEPDISKKADQVLKDARKLRNGDIYASAASRLLDICSNCLDSIDVTTE